MCGWDNVHGKKITLNKIIKRSNIFSSSTWLGLGPQGHDLDIEKNKENFMTTFQMFSYLVHFKISKFRWIV